MQYSDIKTFLSNFYSPFIETAYIDFDSATPSEGAIYLRMVNNRIVSKPFEFEFSKEIGSIPLTGSPTINLATSYPDLLTVYQVYGVNDNQQENFLPNNIANITPVQGYSIRGKTLYFSENVPSSGTLHFQYKSQYMVKDASGNRKLDFAEDDDYSVLDEAHINLLLFGFGEFVNWKSDELSAGRRKQIMDWVLEAFGDVMSTNINTNQLDSLL